MKQRVIYLALPLLLTACVPEYSHYYAPTGEGEIASGSRCGGPNDDITQDKNGITVKAFLPIDDWDSLEKGPDRHLELSLIFDVLEGHTLKIMSDDVQVAIDGEPAPRQAHLVSPSYCDKGINQCALMVNEDISGGGTYRNWQGKDFYSPKKFMQGVVEIPDLKTVPKVVTVVLPPMRFDGGDPEVMRIVFKLESGTFFLAINGC